MKTETDNSTIDLSKQYVYAAEKSQYGNRTNLTLNGQKIMVLEHYTDEKESYDELIVKAVNNHFKLVEALVKLINWHEIHEPISFIETEILQQAKQLIEQLK